MAFVFMAYGVDICVRVWRERHSIVNILDDDSDYTMEMMRRTRTKGAKRGTFMDEAFKKKKKKE